MRKILMQKARTTLLVWSALLPLSGAAWADQPPATSASAEHESKGGPVVRTFGAEGGVRTEVKSETKGMLSQEDRRQASLLAAHVFQHIDAARRALDANESKQARKEVEKGRDAIKAIRDLLPRTTVHTRTTASGGTVLYDDERTLQDETIPLFEGMLHARTFAPIFAARRDEAEVAGVRVVGAETITTEVSADLGYVEAQLARALQALDDKKPDDVTRALVLAQIRGVTVHYNKEDTPLAEARDALWLARRALEENNTVQAQANLGVARQQLKLYREVLPEGRRQDVEQLMTEVNQVEDQLRRESSQPATQAARTNQNNSISRWWDQVNGWFKGRRR